MLVNPDARGPIPRRCQSNSVFTFVLISFPDLLRNGHGHGHDSIVKDTCVEQHLTFPCIADQHDKQDTLYMGEEKGGPWR